METHNSITSLLPAPKSSQKFQMRKMTSIHDKNLVPAHLIKRKDSKKKKPQPTRSPLMPQNPTPSTPQSISGPKRALKNDLSNVNIKIENIISEWNNKNDAADADSSVEHTSKYHMDSIFDDFTLMADNGKKTLTTLASDLQVRYRDERSECVCVNAERRAGVACQAHLFANTKLTTFQFMLASLAAAERGERHRAHRNAERERNEQQERGGDGQLYSGEAVHCGHAGQDKQLHEA